MSDDDKKSELDDVAGTIRQPQSLKAKFRSLADEVIDDDFIISHLTLTSVASATARASSPDQSGDIDKFVVSIKKLDDNKLAVLLKGAVAPEQLGVGTSLKSEVYMVLVEAEAGERQNERAALDRDADHQRELEKARIAARGPIWVVVVKWVLLGAGWIVAAVVGLVKVGSGG